MSNIYMKIPGVNGNVSTDQYKGWIALDSVDFNVTRAIRTVPGRTMNREGSYPMFSEVYITKKLDKSTNALFQRACAGKAFSDIEIHICSTGKTITPYARYKIYSVMVAEHSHGASTDSIPLETLRLNFTKIHIGYIERDASNQTLSPDITGYDLTKAQLA